MPKNPKKSKRNRTWATNWRQLVNQSLHETVSDVESNLMRHGLLTREDGYPAPTHYALKRGFAKDRGDGKWLWNRPRYFKLMRDERRKAKRLSKEPSIWGEAEAAIAEGDYWEATNRVNDAIKAVSKPKRKGR